LSYVERIKLTIGTPLDGSQFMNYRIIMLSSDAVYRRAVGLSLRQLNEDVLFADSIEQAIKLAEQASPTLLITDCSISRLGDGFEFAIAMREQYPQLQCVVTGDTDVVKFRGVAESMSWLQVFRRPFSMVGFMTGVVFALERPPVVAKGEETHAKPSVVAFPKRQLHDEPAVIRPAAAN
jgi:DNA-binding response OmpR family regulator